MGTTALWVPLVVIPASASSLLVLVLDLRAHRRRPRRLPVPSRLTAVLGAALGAGGFGLASIAGIASGAHAAHGPEQVWITTATANGSVSVVPVDPLAIAGLPYAPLEIWGTGFDNDGGWQIAAAVPAGPDVVLASGSWPAVSGEGVRVLAPSVDPAALVAAAKAAGVTPQNGVYTFVLSSSDPKARVVFTLAAPPPPVLQSPASANAASGVPPITGAYASAVRPRSTTAAPAPPPVGVPATGGGAPLVAGLAMLLAGGASAGLSLRLRRPARGA
ncbi:MAG TPA: hypothetical protein VF112_01205 [Candidatus Dormibacteraeota bacterium]